VSSALTLGELSLFEHTLIGLEVDRPPGGNAPLPRRLRTSDTGLPGDGVDPRWRAFLRPFDLEAHLPDDQATAGLDPSEVPRLRRGGPPRGSGTSARICLVPPARAPAPTRPGPGASLGSKSRHPATRYDVTTRRPKCIIERDQLRGGTQSRCGVDAFSSPAVVWEDRGWR
jgi:hypothetical protein